MCGPAPDDHVARAEATPGGSPGPPSPMIAYLSAQFRKPGHRTGRALRVTMIVSTIKGGALRLKTTAGLLLATILAICGCAAIGNDPESRTGSESSAVSLEFTGEDMQEAAAVAMTTNWIDRHGTPLATVFTAAGSCDWSDARLVGTSSCPR